MSYVYMPQVNQYDAIMQPFNPMLGSARDINLVSDAIALGPTRVMNAGDSPGYAHFEQTGLDGVGEWRDALDVFSAVNFLFP